MNCLSLKRILIIQLLQLIITQTNTNNLSL